MNLENPLHRLWDKCDIMTRLITAVHLQHSHNDDLTDIIEILSVVNKGMKIGRITGPSVMNVGRITCNVSLLLF